LVWRPIPRQRKRAPLSLEKISIQDDIITYTSKDGAAHDFDALEFLAQLSVHIPKIYESLTRYYGRYSSRRRGERAKLITTTDTNTNTTQEEVTEKESASDYRSEFKRSAWAACIKRIYEFDPLECPNCRAQMQILACIHNEGSIKAIMKSQGIPEFNAPPQIPRFIDALRSSR
jgi:hypothetical protein